MAIQLKDSFLSVEDYLALEQTSDVRHEYMGGQIYAMTGASARHNRIAGNLFAALHAYLRGSPCEVFMSDVKLYLTVANKDLFYYPDLMVCCDPNDRATHYRTRPCLIVEVLSESTERIDQREKLFAYIQIENLQAYLILSQQSMQANLYRWENGWREEVFTGPQATLMLPCVEGLELELAEVYESIELGPAQ